jgi:hypothetical protein
VRDRARPRPRAARVAGVPPLAGRGARVRVRPQQHGALLCAGVRQRWRRPCCSRPCCGGGALAWPLPPAAHALHTPCAMRHTHTHTHTRLTQVPLASSIPDFLHSGFVEYAFFTGACACVCVCVCACLCFVCVCVCARACMLLSGCKASQALGLCACTVGCVQQPHQCCCFTAAASCTRARTHAHT